MHRTRIKICGITRVGDAIAAAHFGADFVGMILHADSPRLISINRAKQIVDALPETVPPVAVFVNASHELIRNTCAELKIGTAQLHGDESPDAVDELVPLHVWKAVRVDDKLARSVGGWARVSNQLAGLLLDSGPGGSGAPNDWATVRQLLDQRAFDGFRVLIAAGGLTSETVGAVVRDVRPWAVDVSSGVESSKGLKSAHQIEAFIAAVRAADATLA